MTDPPPPELKAFLDRVRHADDPSPERRARVHHAFRERLDASGLPPIGAPRAGGGAERPPVGPASGSLATGVMRTLMVVAALAGAGAVALRFSSDRSSPAPPPQPSRSRPEPTPALEAGAAHGAPAPRSDGDTRSDGDEAASASEPRASSEHARDPHRPARAGGPRPGRRARHAAAPPRRSDDVDRNHDARSSAQGSAPAGRTAPAHATAATHGPLAARAVSARSSSAPPRSHSPSLAPATEARKPDGPLANTPAPVDGAEGTLAREVALMRAIRRAIHAGQYRRALQLLDQHESDFADAALWEERLGFRALALCLAGQRKAGQAAFARFMRSAPDSVLASQLRDACGDEPGSGAGR